jgi:beta-mannanase
MNRLFKPAQWTYLLVAVGMAVLCGCSNRPSPVPPLTTGIPAGATALLPNQGIYTGAYIEFGDTEDHVSLENIERFEELTGKHQAIIASSSYWGENSFPSSNLELIARHNSVPLVFWSPWNRPYEEKRGLDDARLDNILAGRWDDYIDRWADAAKAYDRSLLVSWGLEMNGDWYPWSGYYYNHPAKAADKEGNRHAGPELYKRAYRYVVDRVRGRGAHRIQWVFHANNLCFPNEPWNRIGQYYPGSNYVDWMGLSVYGKQFQDSTWSGFDPLMDAPYRQMSLLDPSKPIIVAEWGVGEFPAAGNKAAWIDEAFAAFKTKYTHVKAIVFWHERWQNQDETISNLRVNSSPESLAAYRTAVADPFFLSYPLIKADQ